MDKDEWQHVTCWQCCHLILDLSEDCFVCRKTGKRFRRRGEINIEVDCEFCNN